MGKTAALGVLLSLALMGHGELPGQEKNFTVLLKRNFTTKTKLFLHPNSPIPEERAQSIELVDFAGTGLEVKYQLSSLNLALSLSVEYLRVSESRPIQVVSLHTEIPTEDGYDAIPIELTGYFIIPASSQTVKIFIGGGAGIYLGKRHYSFANVEAPVTESQPGFGIHVLGGVSYYFTNWFSVTGEMKFRDLQFRSTNAFTQARIPYQNSFINVGLTPFESQVQTDGIVFQLGLGVSF
jgi:hypothetical protein